MDTDRLDRFMKFIVDNGPTGCAVAVTHRGKTVFSQAYGCARIHDGTPVTGRTVFRMYSVTKVVTALAMMQLLEQGKYSLFEPVEKYLPEFAAMQVAEQSYNNAVTLTPAQNKMTIWNLLTMTSGLTYGGSFSEACRQTEKLVEELNRSGYTCREFSRRIAALPLDFEPGSHFRYSYSHDVLGALIEVLSGKSYEQYVKEAIFDPLGMKDSAYFFDDLPGRTVAGYYSRISGKIVEDPIDDDAYTRKRGFASGGAGLLSSLEDMTRLVAELSAKKPRAERIIGHKTVDLMRQDHLNAAQYQDFQHASLGRGWDLLRGYSYGLGVRTLVSLPESGVSGSIGEFGWGSIGGSFIVCDPEEELGICYLHQLRRPDNMENYITPRLKNMVYGMLD